MAREVDRLADEGEATPGEVAVFYRTNAQSRAFEEVFIRSGLPYVIVGGVRFYERREVRDLLAYLRLIANPEDEVSLRRVLNVPRRGIGDRTEESVAALAHQDRTSFTAALARPGDVPGLSPRAVGAIEAFNELIAGLRADADAGVPVADIAEAVLVRSGYVAELEASSDLQDTDRIENLKELVVAAREFDALRGEAGPPDPETPGPAPGSLADFLEQVSLVADADQIPEGEDHGGKVTLMTLPTANGLEFPVVFLTGTEENVFPHPRSANDPRELQEERRLAYWGITRAERRLYLTRAVAAPDNRGSCGAEWAAPEVGQVIDVQWLDEAPDARPFDDVVLTAPGDHAAATNALRAMFTRDFVYLGVSVLQVVLVALVTPILTRRVGVGEFGQLTLAIVVAQVLGVTFNLGLPFVAQKVFAGQDGDRRSRGVLAISAVLAVAASLVVVLAAPAWGPAVGLDRVLDARLAALWAACFALTMTSLAMLRSRDKLRMAIFVAALQSVGAQAAGVLLLYWWAPTVTSYLSGLIIGQGAAALIGLLTLRPVWSALAAIRRYGPIFLFSLPMVPQQLSGYILGLGDRVVIRHDLGSAAVGRYSVAYNVGSLGFILLVFLGWAWMPRIYAVADRVARSRLLASSRDMMNLLLDPSGLWPGCRGPSAARGVGSTIVPPSWADTDCRDHRHLHVPFRAVPGQPTSADERREDWPGGGGNAGRSGGEHRPERRDGSVPRHHRLGYRDRTVLCPVCSAHPAAGEFRSAGPRRLRPAPHPHRWCRRSHLGDWGTADLTRVARHPPGYGCRGPTRLRLVAAPHDGRVRHIQPARDTGRLTRRLEELRVRA